MIWQGNDSPCGHSTSARANREGQKPVSTQASPAELVDGLSATVEKDGRVKFALTRKRKAFAHLTLPANQAGEKVTVARGRVQERLRSAREELDRAEAMVMDRTKAAARATDGYVHDNPWTIAGVCAGVGLLIGMLISRR